MALINCPECGKEISDNANKCVNCGCPIIKYENIYAEKSKKKEKSNCSISDIGDCSITDLGWCQPI